MSHIEDSALTDHGWGTVSFRDPSGSLLNVDGRVIRIVNSCGVRDLTAFLSSKLCCSFVATGRLVGTKLLGIEAAEDLLEYPDVQSLYDRSEDSVLVEHERIPFQSFPYEWPAEMLHAAGILTLDLAEAALKEGLGIKDATPYNVLFRGPSPAFVDVLSFEQRDLGDPIWLPYAQFVRTFLLPLLANKRFGIPLDQLLTTRRDGLEPEDVYRLCSALQKLRPPFLTLASIPTWLNRKRNQDDQRIYQKKSWDNPAKARFFLESLFKRLRRTLKRLEPDSHRRSNWSDYMASNNNYTKEHFVAKHSFVEDAMCEFRPGRVLDVGCNTGEFSEIAAGSGARVVAIDYDAAVVGETWRRAVAGKLDILPLVVNLTRPSPGIGWRNQECLGFLDRAHAQFDALLMLAVVHHMLVTERIPLPDIIELAAELTTDLLVIEFIAPDDSMFRRIVRGREQLFADLTPELFEATCRRRFDIVRTQHIAGTKRWLYLMRRR
jgi:SAM-dependent methyltransferase